jgi:hypothetical protein
VTRNDQLKSKMVELVEYLKEEGRFVKFIRLDDAGENASIEWACKEKCLGIKFSSVVQGYHRRTVRSRESSRITWTCQINAK